MDAYLDTSAIVPLFLTEIHSKAMRAWTAQHVSRLVASDFAAAEFAATVSRATRTGQLTGEQAATALVDFDHWRSHIAKSRLTTWLEIAACERLIRNFSLKLGAADALHLAIARADGLHLITFDERLAEAAFVLKHPAVIPGTPG